MDVSTAFLVPELDYVIFMNLPEQDLVSEHLPAFRRSKLVRLDKALYGLVNSPRLWYQHLSKTLKSMSFAQSASDPCLWVRPSNGSSGPSAAIAIFVDDCAIAAPADEVDSIKAQLTARYSMTDGGPVSWFLGVRVTRTPSSISLSQSATIQALLSEYSMADSRSVSTPADCVLTNVPAKGEPALDQDELTLLIHSPLSRSGWLPLVPAVHEARHCLLRRTAHSLSLAAVPRMLDCCPSRTALPSFNRRPRAALSP
jgi:hypothetical protein